MTIKAETTNPNFGSGYTNSSPDLHKEDNQVGPCWPYSVRFKNFQENRCLHHYSGQPCWVLFINTKCSRNELTSENKGPSYIACAGDCVVDIIHTHGGSELFYLRGTHVGHVRVLSTELSTARVV